MTARGDVAEEASVFLRCRIEGCGHFSVTGSALSESGYWDLDCPQGHCNPFKAETAPPSLRDLYWDRFEKEHRSLDAQARDYLRDYTRRNFSLTA